VFVYDKMPCDSAAAVVSAMRRDPGSRSGAVVGGSVTMPLKQAVLQYCAVLSPAAACIGCVNTLSLQQCGTSSGIDGARAPVHILGDNTDWAGMLACLRRLVRPPITAAVIIGGGATARSAAFALLHLPHITSTCICNRSRARAAALAAEFNVDSFGLDDEQAPLCMRGRSIIIISTVRHCALVAAISRLSHPSLASLLTLKTRSPS
jgi:shikimate dehydrogenase